VRLLVVDRNSTRVEHSRFNRLGEYLRPGDLLVFNTSRTLPASLVGCGPATGPCIEVRLAEHLPDDTWLALLLCRDDPDFFNCGLGTGIQLRFSDALTCQVLAPDATIPRLWQIRFSKTGTELVEELYLIGQPVRYNYVSAPWDLDYYQNVFARDPGSAEMPSAGRAFTWRLLFDLRRRGVQMAYIVLHTTLSSYMVDDLDAQHPAAEEEFVIS
jgi:S-adenosylmethionine:tRNA ribosyltransferase-isomerase